MKWVLMIYKSWKAMVTPRLRVGYRKLTEIILGCGLYFIVEGSLTVADRGLAITLEAWVKVLSGGADIILEISNFAKKAPAVTRSVRQSLYVNAAATTTLPEETTEGVSEKFEQQEEPELVFQPAFGEKLQFPDFTVDSILEWLRCAAKTSTTTEEVEGTNVEESKIWRNEVLDFVESTGTFQDITSSAEVNNQFQATAAVWVAATKQLEEGLENPQGLAKAAMVESVNVLYDECQESPCRTVCLLLAAGVCFVTGAWQEMVEQFLWYPGSVAHALRFSLLGFTWLSVNIGVVELLFLSVRRAKGTERSRILELGIRIVYTVNSILIVVVRRLWRKAGLAILHRTGVESDNRGDAKSPQQSVAKASVDHTIPSDSERTASKDYPDQSGRERFQFVTDSACDVTLVPSSMRKYLFQRAKLKTPLSVKGITAKSSVIEEDGFLPVRVTLENGDFVHILIHVRVLPDLARPLLSTKEMLRWSEYVSYNLSTSNSTEGVSSFKGHIQYKLKGSRKFEKIPVKKTGSNFMLDVTPVVFNSTLFQGMSGRKFLRQDGPNVVAGISRFRYDNQGVAGVCVDSHRERTNCRKRKNIPRNFAKQSTPDSGTADKSVRCAGGPTARYFNEVTAQEPDLAPVPRWTRQRTTENAEEFTVRWDGEGTETTNESTWCCNADGSDYSPVSALRKLNDSVSYNGSPVGSRVKKYFTSEKAWFEGTVTELSYSDRGNPSFTIVYDDDDVETVSPEGLSEILGKSVVTKLKDGSATVTYAKITPRLRTVVEKAGTEVRDTPISYRNPEEAVSALAFYQAIVSGADKSSKNANVQAKGATRTRPTVLPRDTPISGAPADLKVSHDIFRKMLAGRNEADIQLILRNQLIDSLQVHDHGRTLVYDHSYMGALRKSNRSGQRTTIPTRVGEKLAMDIIKGPDTNIGSGEEWALIIFDYYSSYGWVYGLKDTKSGSIVDKLEQFFTDTQFKHTALIQTDFDYKLMGEEVRRYLNKLRIQVRSSPPYTQNQNGKSERMWQSALTMTRNLLVDARLSHRFWLYALKHAFQVLNMMPVRVAISERPEHDVVSTPYYQLWGIKPDGRNLLRWGAVGWTLATKTGEKSRNSWFTQAREGIVLGKAEKANAVTLFMPHTRTVVTTNSFRTDPHFEIQPTFLEKGNSGEKWMKEHGMYNGPVHIQPFDAVANRPEEYKRFIIGQKVRILDGSEVCQVGTIVRVPEFNREEDDDFRVEFDDGSILPYTSAGVLFSAKPTFREATAEDEVNARQYAVAVARLVKRKRFTLSTTAYARTPSLLQSKLSLISFSIWTLLIYMWGTNTVMCTVYTITSTWFGLTVLHLFDVAWLASELPEKKRRTQERRRKERTDDYYALAATMEEVAGNNTAAEKLRDAKLLKNVESPESVRKAMESPDKDIWLRSMKREMESLEKLDTWSVLSADEFQRLRVRALPSFYVLKTKNGGDTNEPTEAKSRLVVCGNRDTSYFKEGDLVAPVCSYDTVLLFVATAVMQGLRLKQGDIGSAFCEAKLSPKEEVYVRPPVDCPKYGKRGTHPHSILKLNKALYGLKQSPRHWYKTFVAFLNGINLETCPNEECSFIGSVIPGRAPLRLVIYVDDFLYYSEDKDVEAEFERLVTARFKVKLDELVGHFLGVDFSWHKNGSVTLSQQGFAKNMVDEFFADGITYDNPKVKQTHRNNVPYVCGVDIESIPTAVQLSSADPTDKRLHARGVKEYRHLIGQLNWLATRTRPDLLYVTTRLARALAHPQGDHVTAYKQVLRYLHCTAELGLTFSPEGTPMNDLATGNKFPVAYATTDADLGGKNHRTAMCARQLFVANGPVSSHLTSRTIATSTTESELVAISEAVKDVDWMANVLEDWKLSSLVVKKFPVFTDSASSVKWASGTGSKMPLRHLNLRGNMVRGKVRDESVELIHIPGTTNPVDICTKAYASAGLNTLWFLKAREAVMGFTRERVERWPIEYSTGKNAQLRMESKIPAEEVRALSVESSEEPAWLQEAEWIEETTTGEHDADARSTRIEGTGQQKQVLELRTLRREEALVDEEILANEEKEPGSRFRYKSTRSVDGKFKGMLRDDKVFISELKRSREIRRLAYNGTGAEVNSNGRVVFSKNVEVFVLQEWDPRKEVWRRRRE